MFFFFKQKTAYEMRISDWSSDVCSSDLEVCRTPARAVQGRSAPARQGTGAPRHLRRSPPLPRPRPRDPHPRRSVEGALRHIEIGRASCRERVCQYVEISVVAGSLKKKNPEYTSRDHTYNKTATND